MKTCNSYQQSLEWCMGTPEMPGIAKRIFYIAKNKIVKWPQIIATEEGQPKKAYTKGSFVLAADEVWHYIIVLGEKSSLTSEPQGENYAQTQLNKLTAFHPGTGEMATRAAAYLNNGDNVFLVEDMNGSFRIVGAEHWITKCTVAQDLGQGATGAPGTTIAVEATDSVPAPFYKGKIITEDGVIDLADEPVRRIISFDANGCTDEQTALANASIVACSQVSYMDNTFEYALKMESNTTLAFSVEKASIMAVVFSNEDTKFTVKVDNVKQTGEQGVLNMALDEGEHTLTKADTGKIVAVIIDEAQE